MTIGTATLRELCEKAPEMFCDYCGKFVGHASWCRAPKSSDEIRQLRSKVEALEWLVEVLLFQPVDYSNLRSAVAYKRNGAPELAEIEAAALRDAGMEVRHA